MLKAGMRLRHRRVGLVVTVLEVLDDGRINLGAGDPLANIPLSGWCLADVLREFKGLIALPAVERLLEDSDILDWKPLSETGPDGTAAELSTEGLETVEENLDGPPEGAPVDLEANEGDDAVSAFEMLYV